MPAIAPEIVLRQREGSLFGKWLSLVSRLQIWSFLTGIVACIICIAATASVQWRVWWVENVKGVRTGNVLVGIWFVCYWKDPNDDGNAFWHCEELNELYPTLPKEIFIAQDLMALTSIMSAVAITVMSFALYNVFKPVKDKDFVRFFFSLGASLNLHAGMLVLFCVIWNTCAVLQNGEIHFPPTFGLPQIPIRQHVGLSMYLGYVAAGFQLLSASLVALERFCRKTPKMSRMETVVLHTAESALSIKSQTSCSKCGSLLDLVVQEETCAVDSKGSIRQRDIRQESI